MKSPTIRFILSITICLIAGLIVVFLLVRKHRELAAGSFVEPAIAEELTRLARTDAGKKTKRSRLSDQEVRAAVSQRARHALLDRLLDQYLQRMLADQRAAIPGEVVLRFKNAETFGQIRERLLVGTRGLASLAELESALALRIGYKEIADLRRLLDGLDEDEVDLAPNYTISLPRTPDPDSPLSGASGGAPFGNSALRFLGVDPGENEGWGTGVVVAVLDSGIAEHPTFREGQVRHVGASEPIELTEEGLNDIANGHGTAVASIIAGSDFRTPGVAPGTQLLSFQLLDSSGSGDSFTLAGMIHDAVTSGADIINLSAGSYGDSQLVREMVELAHSQRRLIVASTGNDAAQVIVYPAAYPDTIAVAAVDADREHLQFSNSGSQLDLAAPGLGVDAAWPNGQMVEFSGTSASAPFVTGAVAAILSENPSLDPIQAWELLQQFTDEAGAPGFDQQVGRGSLNIGRAMERDQRGIFDLSVASHYVETDTTGSSVLVTVQNRGTESVRSSKLEIQSAGRVANFSLPPLLPGEIVTREFGLNLNAADSAGKIGVSSVVSAPRNITDRIPDNNIRQSTVLVNETD